MKKFATIGLLSLALALMSFSASAEIRGVTASTGVESWTWAEYDARGGQLLKEHGVVPFAEFGYTLPGNGVSHNFTAKLAAGSIDYNGQTQAGAPLDTTTRYQSIKLDYSLAYRLPTTEVALNAVGGVGFEMRTRDIHNPLLRMTQREDWHTLYGKAGLETPLPAKAGAYGGAGVVFPIYTSEDAHLTDFGAANNPTLRPKSDIGLYAKVGYRFNERVSIQGTYEGLRYRASDSHLVDFGGMAGAVHQPASSLDRVGVQLIAYF